jgi:hypothetical protein
MYGLCCLPGRTHHTYELSLEPWNIYAFIFTNGGIWGMWNPRGKPKHRGHFINGCITPYKIYLLRRTIHGRCALCSFSQLLTGHKCVCVWGGGNLHNVRLSDGARSAWCMVIHDKIPTIAMLHRIRLMDTDNCT